MGTPPFTHFVFPFRYSRNILINWSAQQSDLPPPPPHNTPRLPAIGSVGTITTRHRRTSSRIASMALDGDDTAFGETERSRTRRDVPPVPATPAIAAAAVVIVCQHLNKGVGVTSPLS